MFKQFKLILGKLRYPMHLTPKKFSHPPFCTFNQTHRKYLKGRMMAWNRSKVTAKVM